ncbi:retrovirus-related pol polyprotein from transposon TNT 1-94 [Tanacetum coccineum]
MVEPEKPLKRKDQISFDEEVARNLEAQLQAELEEEERLARQKEEEANIALIESWDNTQAMMDADFQLLKSKSNDEIQKMFDKEIKRVNIFVDMDTELVKGSATKAKESSSKRADTKLEPEVVKKHKVDDEAEVDDDQEEVEMKSRARVRMLQSIDREDLETLWKLVKAKHRNIRPEEEYERVLWGDLKVMFEPDVESEVWRSLEGHNVTVWKLFDSSEGGRRVLCNVQGNGRRKRKNSVGCGNGRRDCTLLRASYHLLNPPVPSFGLFGLVSILLLIPLLSRIMVNIHLPPQEFVTGLSLYNCMPTSKLSGVALTKLARGNSALALAITELSNLLGILIVHYSVSKIISCGVGASVPKLINLFKS